MKREGNDTISMVHKEEGEGEERGGGSSDKRRVGSRVE